MSSMWLQNPFINLHGDHASLIERKQLLHATPPNENWNLIKDK